MLRHGTAFSNTRRGLVQRTSCIRWHVGMYGVSATRHQCSMVSSASLSSATIQWHVGHDMPTDDMQAKRKALFHLLRCGVKCSLKVVVHCVPLLPQSSRPCCRHKQCPNNNTESLLQFAQPSHVASWAAGACPECGRLLRAAATDIPSVVVLCWQAVASGTALVSWNHKDAAFGLLLSCPLIEFPSSRAFCSRRRIRTAKHKN